MELLDEEGLEEITTSAAVPGYMTPFAFSSKKDKKKKLKRLKKTTGYIAVNEDLNDKDIKQINIYNSNSGNRNDAYEVKISGSNDNTSYTEIETIELDRSYSYSNQNGYQYISGDNPINSIDATITTTTNTIEYPFFILDLGSSKQIKQINIYNSETILSDTHSVKI